VAPPTASGHLAKLTRARMVEVVAQGRHRYYCLASAEVARMLEGIMSFASERPTTVRRATPRIDPAMRRARTCYDHIAGELGVAIADRLVALDAVKLATDSAIVTDTGYRIFRKADIALESSGRSRRPGCRPCLDWSERRPHLAGVLGTVILEHGLRSGVLKRHAGSRALHIAGEIPDVLRKLGFP